MRSPGTGAYATPSSRIWRGWTLSCAAGEVIGIGVVAAIAGLLALTMGEPVTWAERLFVLAVMVAAGGLEGLALGFFQWQVLRERLDAVTPSSWIGATAAVSAGGWLLGMLPSTLSTAAGASPEPAPEPPVGAILALALAFGLTVGSIFGAAQWLVLRRHAQRAEKWILANALGWALALPWVYLAASIPPPGAGVGTKVVLGVAGGALSGLSMGVVTGAFLLRLRPRVAGGGVMRCREIMKTDVARCLETLTVEACAQMMRDNNIGFVPVVDADQQVVGVVTDRDLAVRVLASDLPRETPVGQIMTRDVRICRPEEDLQAAEWKMSSARKSRLVVADEEGHCVGVISLSDIAQADNRSRAGGVLRAVTRREAPAHVVLS